MNAREAIAQFIGKSSLTPKASADLLITHLSTAGFTIMSKEDVEAVACVERGSAQSTPQPESRLREALEEIAALKLDRVMADDYNRGFTDGRWQAVKIALAALAQEDGR